MKTISDYTILCTQEQTLKAIELGAPIEGIFIPTAEQMIGFLRSKGIKFNFNDAVKYWSCSFGYVGIDCGWSENKELDAIDAALDYLIENKK